MPSMSLFSFYNSFYSCFWEPARVSRRVRVNPASNPSLQIRAGALWPLGHPARSVSRSAATARSPQSSQQRAGSQARMKLHAAQGRSGVREGPTRVCSCGGGGGRGGRDGGWGAPGEAPVSAGTGKSLLPSCYRQMLKNQTIKKKTYQGKRAKELFFFFWPSL